MRAKRTQEQLRQDSKTLWYEFGQFIAVVGHLRQDSIAVDVTVQNALVESFALHCRALSYFFFGGTEYFKNLKSEDIHVHDFFDNKRLFPNDSPPQLLREAKTQCNKQVAHMTSSRRELNFIPDCESQWQVDEIESELIGLLERFLKEVDKCKLEPKAFDDLRRFCSERRTRVDQTRPQPGNLTAKTCPPSDNGTTIGW